MAFLAALVRTNEAGVVLGMAPPSCMALTSYFTITDTRSYFTTTDTTLLQVFISAWQDAKMNASLFLLSQVSFLLIPIQTITGWYV